MTPVPKKKHTRSRSNKRFGKKLPNAGLLRAKYLRAKKIEKKNK